MKSKSKTMLFAVCVIMAHVNSVFAKSTLQELASSGYEVKSSAVLPDKAERENPIHAIYMQKATSIYLCLVRSAFVNKVDPEKYGEMFVCFELTK